MESPTALSAPCGAGAPTSKASPLPQLSLRIRRPRGVLYEIRTSTSLKYPSKELGTVPQIVRSYSRTLEPISSSGFPLAALTARPPRRAHGHGRIALAKCGVFLITLGRLGLAGSGQHSLVHVVAWRGVSYTTSSWAHETRARERGEDRNSRPCSDQRSVEAMHEAREADSPAQQSFSLSLDGKVNFLPGKKLTARWGLGGTV